MIYKAIILLFLVENIACKTDELSEATEPIPGAIYKVSFDKINEYLEKKVPVKDANENLAALNDWLANDLRKNIPNGDNNLIQAVELFISLDKLAKDDACSENSLEILMNNDAAIRGKILNDEGDDDDVGHENEDEDLERRIEQIFDFYAEKYGSACIPPEALPGESGTGYYEKSYLDTRGKHGVGHRIAEFFRKLKFNLTRLRYRRQFKDLERRYQ